MTLCGPKLPELGCALTTTMHGIWYDLGDGLLRRYLQDMSGRELWRGTLRATDSRADDLFNPQAIDAPESCCLPGEVPDA